MGEDALGHGAAADVAVADKEHANTQKALFCRNLPCFATFKNVQGIVTMPSDIDFSYIS